MTLEITCPPRPADGQGIWGLYDRVVTVTEPGKTYPCSRIIKDKLVARCMIDKQWWIVDVSKADGYPPVAGPFDTPELAWTTLKLTA